MAVITANSTVTQWIPGRAHLKDSARSSPGASSSHHPRNEIFSIIFLHLRLPWIKFLLPPLLGQPRAWAVGIGCEVLNGCTWLRKGEEKNRPEPQWLVLLRDWRIDLPEMLWLKKKCAWILPPFICPTYLPLNSVFQNHVSYICIITMVTRSIQTSLHKGCWVISLNQDTFTLVFHLLSVPEMCKFPPKWCLQFSVFHSLHSLCISPHHRWTMRMSSKSTILVQLSS